MPFGSPAAETARPTAQVLDALREADQIVVCPSNPIVSIGPLLAVPGILPALTSRREDIIAVSPIVAGAALKGPADRLMAELGSDPSVVGVARLYAPWVSTLVIDEADRDQRGGGRGRRAALHRCPHHHGLPRARGSTGSIGDRRRWLTASRSFPSRGIGEIEPGTDLAHMVAERAGAGFAGRPRHCRQGDVLVITQKVVSKAEGRLVAIDPDDPDSQGRSGRAGIGAHRAPSR